MLLRVLCVTQFFIFFLELYIAAIEGPLNVPVLRDRGVVTVAFYFLYDRRVLLVKNNVPHRVAIGIPPAMGKCEYSSIAPVRTAQRTTFGVYLFSHLVDPLRIPHSSIRDNTGWQVEPGDVISRILSV